MTHQAKAITNYNFKSSDNLLLDTNIWLFNYGPQSPMANEQVTIYSGALAKILAAKSRIYIDVLIVSEFINAYARTKYNLLSPQYIKFKQFRKSKDFKPVAQEIAASVKRVLQHCDRVENGFELLAIDTMLDEHAVGDSDFNDQILTALCKRNELKLVTDDSDFKGQGIFLITANKRLL